MRRIGSLKRFRLLDHAGDVGIEAYGRSLSELFQNAAQAFFRIITDPSKVRRRLARRLVLRRESTEHLLVAWLSEFIYLFETQGLLFNRFSIHRVDGQSLEALAEGEIYEEARHPIQTLVKAVTFHGLHVQEVDGLWQARIILDL